MPAGVAGLTFRDEAQTVNALVPELRQQGIEAIVVLIHEGGVPTGDYNECPGICGPIVEIVKKLDKAVDLVISGHTHRAYNCRIDGRLVTSGDKYGTIVTQIDLSLDPKTGDVIDAVADNVSCAPTLAKNPEQTELIAAYEKLAVPLAKRVVGRIGAPLTLDANPAGETPLGDIIADAQLAATQKAGGADRPDEPGRHPLGPRHDGGWPASLRRPVLGAAVLQQAGDDDADGPAAQARARAAMDRPEASADPAGLERIYLRLGQQQGRRRAHHRRTHDA